MRASECFQVILGDHQWNSETETEHYRTDVINIVNHPNYNEETSDSDFSLLELAKSVTWSLYRHIRPVCLPTDTSEDYVGQLATVTGWGALSWPDSSTVLPDFPAVLQEVNVTIISNDACRTDYKYEPSHISEMMLCATAGGDKDSCSGDSGGPLTVYDHHHQYQTQVGVVSFGYKCAEADYPGVYAR